MSRLLKSLSLILMLIAISISGEVDTVVTDEALPCEQMYLLPSYSSYKSVREISGNVCECDVATVSNIVLKMCQQGFLVERKECTSKYIDIILSKGEEKYRLYYTKEGILTSIAELYENSYKPMTYIIEGEE